MSEAVARKFSAKKAARKTPLPNSMFSKDLGCRPATIFSKKDSGTDVFYEFPKISQSNYYVE